MRRGGEEGEGRGRVDRACARAEPAMPAPTITMSYALSPMSRIRKEDGGGREINERLRVKNSKSNDRVWDHVPLFSISPGLSRA